jgi:DNA mismatch repair protein MSH6
VFIRYGNAAEARKLLLGGGYFGGGDASEWPVILREAAEQEPPVAFAAFGCCLKYLQRLLLDRQLIPHAHFSAWRASDDPGVDHGEGSATQLMVDGKTLENLEVFANTTDGSDKGTLFSVLDRTATAFGKRELRKWLCAPLCRLSDIIERQDAVAALLSAPDVREALGGALKQLPDLERLIARVHSSSIDQVGGAPASA